MYFSIQDSVSHGIAPIYTQLFLVKLKSVVDGPILHSKSVVDGSILHSKAKVCVFSVFMMVRLQECVSKDLKVGGFQNI